MSEHMFGRGGCDSGSLLILRLRHWTLTEIQGLFTVLMCSDCQAARGHRTGPYPTMTRAQLRASLDLLPTWVLEHKATANRHVIVVKRKQLAAGEEVARMYQAPGLAWLERQARSPRT